MTSKNQRLRRIRRHAALSVLMAALCCAPLPMTALGLRPHDCPAPDAADPPSLPSSLRDVLSYPGALKHYFDNSFATRETTASIHGQLIMAFLKSSPNPDVVIGLNGWLYLKSESGIDQYRNLRPFTKESLDSWAESIMDAEAMAESHGATFIFAPSPNKPTIYPENLPESMSSRINTPGRLDSLLERLAANKVAFSNPTQALETASERTYHKTDTHWNDFGAFVATEDLLDRISDLKGVRRAALNTSIVTSESQGGDLARLIGRKCAMHEELISIVCEISATLENGDPIPSPEMDAPMILRDRLVTVSPQAPFGSAVIFIDSFGHVMIPHLARAFRRCVFVRGHTIEESLIASEKPSFVILQLVERRLMEPSERVLR